MNAHKVVAQVRKAGELADALIEAGCDADAARNLDAVGWALATQVVSARRGRPVDLPSDDVKELVYSALEQRAQPLDSSLLEGLPTP